MSKNARWLTISDIENLAKIRPVVEAHVRKGKVDDIDSTIIDATGATVFFLSRSANKGRKRSPQAIRVINPDLIEQAEDEIAIALGWEKAGAGGGA